MVGEKGGDLELFLSVIIGQWLLPLALARDRAAANGLPRHSSSLGSTAQQAGQRLVAASGGVPLLATLQPSTWGLGNPRQRTSIRKLQRPRT